MRNFRRDIKAISPVLAVLMMIAVAVAGSLVTYAWVMGYIGFTQSKAGRAIMVQSMANSAVEVPCDLVVYVQNVGEGTVTFDPAGCTYVDGGLEPAVITVAGVETNLLQPDETAMIVIADKGALPGQRVRVRVVTHGGTFMEAASYPGESTGGGGILPPPDVIQVSSTDTGFSGVIAGDLLVVMPNHRTGTFATDGETCTAAGYTTVEVASWWTSTGDRRAVAVLIKNATGSETGTVDCTWGSGVTTYATLYQIFRGATTWTPGESGVAHTGSSLTNNLAVPSSPLSAGTGGNILTIGTMVFRDDPGAVTMPNLDTQGIASSGGSYPCVTVSEFNYGDAVTDTAVTWATNRMASGLLVQIACE